MPRFDGDRCPRRVRRGPRPAFLPLGGHTIEGTAELKKIEPGTAFRTAAEHTKGVTEVFKGDELNAIDRENALRLIPA
jgi:hypothetical protein